MADLQTEYWTPEDTVPPELTVTGDTDGSNGVNDTLVGNASANEIDGKSGSDTIYGAGGSDTLIGGPGADELFGGTDNDTLEGGNDGDTLYGGSGNDDLDGENGDDTLIGGKDDDSLSGGHGDDTFVFRFCVDEPEGGGGPSGSFTQYLIDNGLWVDTGAEGVDTDEWSQGFFSSNYTNWLLDVVIGENREALGLSETDVVTVDINQNDPDGAPIFSVNGEVRADLSDLFGDRDSFEWTSGAKKPVTHERWWSDSFTIAGGGDPTIEGEGNDTITDFGSGVNKLSFAGLSNDNTQANYWGNWLTEDSDADVDNTVIQFNGGSITLLGISNEDFDFATWIGDGRIEFV